MRSLTRTQVVLLASSSGINPFSRGRACTSMKCSGFCGARSASGYLSALYPAGSRGRTSGRGFLLLALFVVSLFATIGFENWPSGSTIRPEPAANERTKDRKHGRPSQTIGDDLLQRMATLAQVYPVAVSSTEQISPTCCPSTSCSSSAHSAFSNYLLRVPSAEGPPPSHAPPNIPPQTIPELLHGAYGSQLIQGANGRER